MSTSTNQDSRDQAIDRTQFLGEGRIGQLIRRLSVPAIGSMVSIALFQLVDAIFIGTLGTASLGAVSVAFPLFTVVGGVGQIFGTGAASMISRYLGANRSDDADKVASASLLGVLVAGVITATAINFILDPLLHALGGTDSIIAVGRGYARSNPRVRQCANHAQRHHDEHCSRRGQHQTWHVFGLYLRRP